MKNLKPKYMVASSSKGLHEVICDDGTIMDRISSMEAAAAIARLACLRHLARDQESGMLYIMDSPIEDDYELDTIEEWVAYCQQLNEDENLDGLTSDDAPPVSVTNDTAPSMPVQKVGV